MSLCNLHLVAYDLPVHKVSVKKYCMFGAGFGVANIETSQNAF